MTECLTNYLYKLLENIIYILVLDISNIFEVDVEEDLDYYMTEVLCNFIKGLCNCSKKEELYLRDMNSVTKNFFNVLEDADMTIGGDFEDNNSLSKLKSKALIIRNLEDDEFIDVLDDNVDELTETTINDYTKI